MEDSNFRKLSKTQILYYSNLLTLRKPKWEMGAASSILITAKVDPIPHQVEAAQFAFRNPFSGGVILGDEVGLGKTIETGLILSQYWAEGKRKVLIIAPKSLRHQWQDELLNLFYIEAEIIDTNSYAKVAKGSLPDPLEEDEKVLITNEHFVAKYQEEILKAGWDVVVIDEAHKLRNVWKTGKNEAKRAKAIREAILPFKKLLLTATPMQNNLMELFGLCSFIDPHALGTVESFKRNFTNISEDELQSKLDDLKYRMSKFFKRELRKNVQAFIPYTNRNAVTIPFDPTESEEKLRITFENYLKDPNTIALPPIANGFLRLVYFKLLASSSFALKNSLGNLYIKLIHASVSLNDEVLYNKIMDEAEENLLLDNGNDSEELVRLKKILFKNISLKTFSALREKYQESDDFVDLMESEEIQNNYEDEDLENSEFQSSNLEDHKEAILVESRIILDLIKLSQTLSKNSKGTALVHAIEQQFKKAKDNNWPEKAVIFTEFKTTQKYIIEVLERMGLNRIDDIVIFNGDSGSAEERRELVEDFRDSKKIFLTTEAGSEGLNLQFCNLVINYDLPWNPQRIEQRIGRCHRYGQKFDVVVVNFANQKNVADQRILELLDSKFKLFEGAFGVSNTVLGQIESGTDIEKEILNIYLSCQNEDEIEERFEKLMNETIDIREDQFKITQDIISSEFDEEVQKKLKALDKEMRDDINEVEALTRDIVLSSLSKFSYSNGILRIDKNEIGLEHSDSYTFERSNESSKLISLNHKIIKDVSESTLAVSKLKFNYSGNHNISLIEKYIGKSGSFSIFKSSFHGVDKKDILFPIFTLSNGDVLTHEESQKLISVKCLECDTNLESTNQHNDIVEQRIENEKLLLEEYNEDLYNEEIDKLDCYFEDLQELKKREISDIEKEMEKLKKERRKLKLAETRAINIKITKLKKLIIKKEEEITQLRKDNADKEKDRLNELNTLSEIRIETKLIAYGEFEVI